MTLFMAVHDVICVKDLYYNFCNSKEISNITGMAVYETLG